MSRSVLAIRETSSADILFALNPETVEWAKQGFTSHSNWWVWMTLGFDPQKADPSSSPQLDNASLAMLVVNHVQEPVGWETLNTGAVTAMGGLFHSATKFNTPIDNWDTGNVTSMHHMFFGATAFNQSLAKWDITHIEDMNYMFTGSGISIANLSQTLEGWAHHATTKTVQNFVLLYGLPHTFNSLTTEAQHAIKTLCNKHGWRINFDRQQTNNT